MKLVSIKDKEILFKNNYEEKTIELIHDIEFRLEYRDNNSCIGYLKTRIFNSETQDFFIDITTISHYIGIKENTEEIHKKCFALVWKHIQKLVKEISKTAGQIAPIDLLNFDELVNRGVCRKKYTLNVL